jgi:ABC-type bacteriocin/lantibiotic exporter with double-glycine peptidase domain
VKDTCGAASLAMVMRYWGQEITQDQIAARLLQKDLHGIRGSKLEEFARERGLVAIAYTGDRDQVRDYLAKGRPLIVAWRVGRDRYHDVVVVGYDAEKGEFLVHDPAEGASRRVTAASFEKRWAGAGHWTLLVLPQPPA